MPTFMDYHQKLPPMPPEAFDQVRANLGAKKADEFGVTRRRRGGEVASGPRRPSDQGKRRRGHELSLGNRRRASDSPFYDSTKWPRL